MYKRLVKGSVERKTIGAVFASLGTKGRLWLHQNFGCSMGGNALDSALANSKYLERGQKIPVVPRRVQKYHQDNLRTMVQFILDYRNISLISWGERKVKLDKYETVKLPIFTR